MSEQNTERQLGELAAYAARTGRLADAATIRFRGDRRRRRRHAGAAALGVVLAAVVGTGIALGHPADRHRPLPTTDDHTPRPTATSPTPSLTPSTPGASAQRPTSRPPSSTPASATVDPLSGRRQLNLVLAGDPRAGVRVGTSGRADISRNLDERALFVPVRIRPGGDDFLLKTGALRGGGQARCLMISSGGQGRPLVLKAASCDAGNADQKFRFSPLRRDQAGRRTYDVSVNAYQVLYFADSGDGLLVQEYGEGDNSTPFVLVDRGPARLP